MKKITKIEDFSSHNYIKINVASTFDFSKIIKYSQKRRLEIMHDQEKFDKLFLKDNISDKIINKNNKDFKKKEKEYFQLIEFLKNFNLKYHIKDFSEEDYDAIIEIENAKIGIEITQLVLNQSYKELSANVGAILNDFKEKYNYIKKLVSLSINYSLFFEDKKKFCVELTNEINDYLLTKKKNNNSLLIKKVTTTVNDELIIVIDNYPINNISVSNEIISKILKNKDSKLTEKIKGESKVDIKWLLIYSEGDFYDDFRKVDSDAFNNLTCENFDKLCLYNRRRNIIKIIHLS